MTDKTILSLADVDELARVAAAEIRSRIQPGAHPNVYGVPRGGVSAAYVIGRFVPIKLVTEPADADFIVDDLIDSGSTMARVLEAAAHPSNGRQTFKEPPVPIVLIDKREAPWKDKWVVFPWEGDTGGSTEDIVTRLLQFVGEDVEREGLRETPARVVKAWEEWTSGYSMNPEDILKTFEDGATNVNEMVMVKDIPLYSKCEHHLADIFGTATVAYIPDGKIVGLSKLNRLVDCFARRLQVQERLTTQIADSIMQHLNPKGVGVIVTARHMCMESRGVRQHGHSTTTSALRGVFENGTVRSEFLHLAK